MCGGSAGELCLSCASPIVNETSVMNKTCDPVSIRVQGFDPEFRVPGLVFVAGGGGHFKLFLIGTHPYPSVAILVQISCNAWIGLLNQWLSDS